MDRLKAHFEKEFNKKGVALTGAQLYSFAQLKKLPGVTKKKIYKFLQTHPHIAHFSTLRKTKIFQSATVLRPGVYHIDYAEFHKHWAGSNKNATGFLIAVENFTNKIFAAPSRGKGTPEWLAAISSFVEQTRNVRVILSDRDSVAKSENFRAKIIRDYGIMWDFLRKGNKAYLAERYVRFLKTKLSQVLDLKGGKKWIQYLPAICSEYNQTKVEGTSFRRHAVSEANFSLFLSQLLKTTEPELLFNSAKAGPFVTEAWNRKIFKFNLGEKVLLARAANWADGTERLRTFVRASTRGGFGKNVYTVGGRQLRTTKHFKSYVPVYSLLELGPSLHFYTNELKKAPPTFVVAD
jgi:hypothetical protein